MKGDIYIAGSPARKHIDILLDLLKGDIYIYMDRQRRPLLMRHICWSPQRRHIGGLLTGDINADQAAAAMGRCKSLAQDMWKKGRRLNRKAMHAHLLFPSFLQAIVGLIVAP